MLGYSLSRQLSRAEPVRRLHVLLAATVAAVALAAAFGSRQGPSGMIEWLAWSQLFVGILGGGCLTGWRVAQYPKSRACEFHLVLPIDDWRLVLAETGAGLLRTVALVAVTTPALVLLVALRWLSSVEAGALVAIPIAAGWLTGIGMAVVAYEPMWVRQCLERIVLGGIIVYLALFGLLGQYVVPSLVDVWQAWTNIPGFVLADGEAMLAYYNPFRLLGSIGAVSTDGHEWVRVVSVCGLMLAVTAIALCRLVRRLRPHYCEENYGRQFARKEYNREIGDRPLSWWTARRVRRFRGNINLYLAWTTVALYCGYILFQQNWPRWLAYRQMYMLDYYGGGPLLAVLALQLAVVPICFLNGLWDSNQELRGKRLELLLTTPMSAWDYLHASLVAGWTRGKGYVVAAACLWAALLATGRITPIQFLVASFVAANFLLLHFAIAFREFARLENDRAVGMKGMVWSVGMPLVTLGLFQLGWTAAALGTPLGAAYLISLPIPLASASLNVSMLGFYTVLAMQQLVYFSAAIVSLRISLARFDTEIRDWFSSHLGGDAEVFKPTPARKRALFLGRRACRSV